MDDDVKREIENLLQAVYQTDIYREYRKQEELLKKDPELAERVNQFRANNFHLQNEASSDELFQVVGRIYQESRELRKNPEVNAYLDAELALCKLMQKIVRRLTAGIDMEVPEYY